VGLYDLVDGHLVRRSSSEFDVDGERTEVPQLVGERQPDLVLLNDGDLSYTKIRLDERSQQTVVHHIADFEDPLAAAISFGAAWDMTRDAEMAASDWVTLVLNGLGPNTGATAARTLTLQTRRVVATYTDPEHRSTEAARWESGLHRLVLAADPGSDQQLTYLQALADVAHSDDTLGLIHGLLDGSQPVTGLVVDADLRWTLLSGLARAGRVSVDTVAAELARDNTINGRQRAAAARAAMPTAEAKANAWRDMVERDELPNETVRSIAMAFNQPNQADVLTPYVAKYLTAADTLWEDKGAHEGQLLLRMLFPWAEASARTRAAVQQWLDHTTAEPAPRRFMREGLANLDRALRAQATDAQAH
ncbi:MAG: ERAP1-like C-terminal domain-containing protein, partial [Sciscionella sp.]